MSVGAQMPWDIEAWHGVAKEMGVDIDALRDADEIKRRAFREPAAESEIMGTIRDISRGD